MLFLEIVDKKNGHWMNEVSTVLDEELLDYFARFNEYPAFQELRLLDPYDDTLLGPPRCRQLKAEIAAMAPLVRTAGAPRAAGLRRAGGDRRHPGRGRARLAGPPGVPHPSPPPPRPGRGSGAGALGDRGVTPYALMRTAGSPTTT